MVTVNGNTAEFHFFRPQARAVELVGDFTHWRNGGLAMRRTAEKSRRPYIGYLPGMPSMPR